MCTVLPESIEPDCFADLVTITPMNAGNGPAGGGVLLPVSEFQPVPHAGVVGASAKPLKLAGADPPLSELSFHHLAPQKVTDVPFARLLSPITKAPPPGAKAKTSPLHPGVDVVLPPTSLMVVVIVKGPVEV